MSSSKRIFEIVLPAFLVGLVIFIRTYMDLSGKVFNKTSIIVEFLLLAGAIVTIAYSSRNSEEEVIKNGYLFISWIFLMALDIEFGLDMLTAFCCVQVAELLLLGRLALKSDNKAFVEYHKDWIGSLFSFVAFVAVVFMADGYIFGTDFYMVAAMILIAFVMLSSLTTGKFDSWNRFFQLVAAALSLILIVVWPIGASQLLWWLTLINVGLKIQSFLTTFKTDSSN